MHSYQRYVKQPEKKKNLVFIAAVIGNKVKEMKSKATEGTRTTVLVGKKLVF